MTSNSSRADAADAAAAGALPRQTPPDVLRAFEPPPPVPADDDRETRRLAESWERARN